MDSIIDLKDPKLSIIFINGLSNLVKKCFGQVQVWLLFKFKIHYNNILHTESRVTAEFDWDNETWKSIDSIPVGKQSWGDVYPVAG